MAGETPRAIAAVTSRTETVRIALLTVFMVIPDGFDSAPIRLAHPVIEIIAPTLLMSPHKRHDTKTQGRADGHDEAADRSHRHRHQSRADALLPLSSTDNNAARPNPADTQPSRATAPSAMTRAPAAAPIALPR